MEKEVQKVEIYLAMFGNYAAFHEVDYMVMYDITNDKKVEGEETIEELEDWKDNSKDWGDVDIVDALLIDGKYYYSL